MQSELRRAPEESFPLAAEFQKAAQAETLIAPETVALFLEWILKIVPDVDYARTTPWNVYDGWHRQKWIQGHSLPLPLNQAKLGDQSEKIDRELQLAEQATNSTAPIHTSGHFFSAAKQGAKTAGVDEFCGFKPGFLIGKRF